MNFDTEKYLINDSASIKEALLKVEENSYGLILTQTSSGKVVGLATDGDIRRAFLRGLTLEDGIAECVNREFISASISFSREQLLKRLDSGVRFIPIIDKLGKLHSIISKDHLPLEREKSTYIRARAPVRVSFGGGGSDLTHFFTNSSGAVINTAISIYSHGVMKVRDDSRIIINSLDLRATLDADNLAEALLQKGPFGLIQSLLHVVQPNYGFELFLRSDFPIGSGLGGSATISAVILGCFNMLRRDKWNQHELAEIAFQAERLHLGIAGGWQDQYVAVFGGFNFIEFHSDENIINPIRVHPEIALELEESLVLCDTGLAHHSGNILEDQKKTMMSASTQEMVKSNVELTFETRNHLLRGDLDKFGACLNTAWQLKRKFSSKISSKYIDLIYSGALEHGATGGKLLGAGGGGFFIFFVPPFKRHILISYLESKNLSSHPFHFEPDGLKTWVSRDKSARLIGEV